jgi:hypothetical protein
MRVHEDLGQMLGVITYFHVNIMERCKGMTESEKMVLIKM